MKNILIKKYKKLFTLNIVFVLCFASGYRVQAETNSGKTLTGLDVYKKNCMPCHGRGEASSAIRPITTWPGRKTQEELKIKILTGGFSMPPIPLQKNELNLVTSFIFNDLETHVFKDEEIAKSAGTYRQTFKDYTHFSNQVLSSGYDNYNSKVVESHIGASNIGTLVEEYHPALSYAGKITNLFARNFNGHDRAILFGTQDGYIRAYDIDNKSIIWETDLSSEYNGQVKPGQKLYSTPAKELYSTPALDEENNKLYGLTVGWGKKEEGGRFLHHFAIVDSSTGELEQLCPVWQSDYVTDNNISLDALTEHLHCKTSVAYTKNDKQRTLYIGCSIRIGGGDYMYADPNGPPGVIVSLSSNKQGEFNQCKTHIQPMSSEADTGVYMAGAKPAILPNNDLLITTGNGPVDISKGNYGCAIIRLNPDLSLKRDKSGKPYAINYEKDGGRECWLQNFEYTVGSTSIVDINGSLIASAQAKDGSVVFFKPDLMAKGASAVVKIEAGGKSTYGTPLAYERNGEAVFIASIRGKASLVDDRENALIEYYEQQSDELLDTSYDGHENLGCYGYVKTHGESSPLRLYYSGDIKKDYAVAVDGSNYSKEMVSLYTDLFGSKGTRYYWKGLWSPYEPNRVLGYSVNAAEAADVIAASKLTMELSNTLPLFMGGYDRPGISGDKTYADFSYLKVLEDVQQCPDIGKDYLPLYKVKRDLRNKELFQNDTVVAYAVTEDLKVRILWAHSFKAHEELTYTHPVMSRSPNSGSAVVVGVVSKTSPVQNLIIALNGKTGEEVWRNPIDARPHFSMPLIFDEYLLQPTPLGIHVFRLP